VEVFFYFFAFVISPYACLCRFLSYEIFSGGINEYSEEVLSWNSGKELLIPVKRHNFSKCAQFNEHNDGAPQMLHSSLPSQW